MKNQIFIVIISIFLSGIFLLVYKKYGQKIKSTIDLTNPKVAYLFSILVNTILFFPCIVFFEAYFETNDDSVMMLLASGRSIVSDSTPYIIFMHIFVGKFLVMLYNFTTFIEWYLYLFYFCLFISYNRLLYILIKNKKTFNIVLGYILFFMLYLITTIGVSLQFTVVASVLAITGVYNILFVDKITIKVIFITTFYLILSSLIRYDSTLLILLISIPVFLFIWRKKSIHFFVYSLSSLGLISLICFALNLYNQNHYKTNYKDYYTYNSYRAAILDYAAIGKLEKEQQQKVLEQVGWSQNDYVMFMTWFFTDEQIYNLENYKKIINSIKIDSKIDIRMFLISIYIYLRSEYAVFYPFLLIVLFLFNKTTLKFASLLLIWYVLLIGIVSMLLKPLPDRILLSLHIFFVYTLFFVNSMRSDDANYFNDLKNYISIIINKIKLNTFFKNIHQKLQLSINTYILFIIFVILFYTTIDEYNKKYDNQLIFQKDARLINDFVNKQKSKLNIASWGTGFPFEIFSPNDYSIFNKITIFGLGTGQHTLDSKMHLKKNNINDIYRDLLEKEDFLLMYSKDDNPKALDHYKTYMQEHYGIDKNQIKQDTLFETQTKITIKLKLEEKE